MRQLRAWLAQQSIESLATNYVVMTEDDTPRPRIYTLKDLETEIKRRISIEQNIPLDYVLIDVAFEDTIEKAKQIYQLLGG